VLASYALPAKDVFVRAVRTSIADSGSLGPLFRVDELGRSEDLPTWVLDWCVGLPKPVQHIWDVDWLRIFKLFNTALGREAAMLDLSPEPVLALQDLSVDEICKIRCYFPNNDSDDICVVTSR
jgi:hypothetical protein